MSGARGLLRGLGGGLRRLLRSAPYLEAQIRQAVAWSRAHPRRAGLAAVGLVGLSALAWNLVGGEEAGVHLVAAVQEGPFEVTVVESGTLQALRSVTYSSQIPGNQAKVVHLVPEGSLVKEGDLIIGLDPSPFAEEARRAEAQLAQARAERVKAEQDLKLQALQNQEQLAEAHSKVRLAELELASVMEGRGKLEEAESEAAVANARRELEKAIANYDDLKPLLAEGFITQLELDRARQAVDKAREDLKLLEIKHRTFKEFTRPADIEGSRAAVGTNKEGLRQVESAAEYRLSQARAALELAASKSAELAAKLEENRRHLAACEIRATHSGIVIYQDVFFGSERRKVQVGDQVWPNQPLAILPDLSQMVVATRIRETDIHKVEKGQRVMVTPDAYPELRLQGRVNLIGTLAQEEREESSTRPRRSFGKFFDLSVLVEDSDPRLRPGMSARVELLVDQIPKARYVPLEAVFERGGRRYCYVLRRGRAEAKEVLTGPSNDHHIVIEAGLELGERVLLSDPVEPGRPLGGAALPGSFDLTPGGAPPAPR
jgi:HlyD family secretion protein